MQVTNITKLKVKYKIDLENGKHFYVSEDTIIKYGLIKKIDLSKENNYISYDFKKNNFLDMIKFFEFKKIKEEILASNEIHYIGDGITNSELVFSGKEFFKVLEFLFENIPEHHYFFDEDRRWCLLIATEGWIAYGEKSIKK